MPAFNMILMAIPALVAVVFPAAVALVVWIWLKGELGHHRRYRRP
jgi:HAMP domain-containing protein